MTEILTYRGAVYPWHCDHMGHMNVMWYVGKFDEANWNLFAACGLTPTYFRDGRYGMAAVQQTIHYKRELLAGATVEVRSRVIEVKDKLVRLGHAMHDALTGELAATCEIVGVHTDRQMRRSCPFPEEIRRTALALTADDGVTSNAPPAGARAAV